MFFAAQFSDIDRRHNSSLSLKKGHEKQRLVAHGNILANKDVQHFFSVAFPTSAHVATLVRKLSYQLINERPASC